MRTNQATQTQPTDPMWLELQHLRNMVEKQRTSSRRWRAAGLCCLAVGVMAGAGFQEQKDLFADTITAKRILLKDDAGAVRLDLNAQAGNGMAQLVINGGKNNTKRIMLHADAEEGGSITAWDGAMIARADTKSGRANWFVAGDGKSGSQMLFNSDTSETPVESSTLNSAGISAVSKGGKEMWAFSTGLRVSDAESRTLINPGIVTLNAEGGNQAIHGANLSLYLGENGVKTNLSATGLRCEDTKKRNETSIYSWGTWVENRFGHSASLSTRDSGEVGLTLRNGKLTTGGFVTSPKARVFFGISGNGDKPNFYLHTDQNAAFSWYREKSPLEQAKEVWDGIQMIRDAGEMLGGGSKK